MTHIHGSSLLVEVFYCLLLGAKWGPGRLRPSWGLCLGLGAAVSTEAECSRVLRGEEGLGAEGPGSFLHSILGAHRLEARQGADCHTLVIHAAALGTGQHVHETVHLGCRAT
eukprot:bmy_11789T0